jgi:predicted Zn-dependent peptidase
MKKLSILAAAFAALAVIAYVGIDPAIGDNHASDDPAIAHERYTLANGLEVILHQDNSVPIVAVDVWYHVGSGNERVGRSGFAHLFEHMLFQGSEHVGEDRHFAILQNVGATGVNGTTNTDRTNYFEVVPSHQLETALWLESDRLGYLLPVVTRKSLDNQIEVVRNERRQRVDNVPYGPTYMKMVETLYPEGHPYRYSVIGKHEDLSAASLDDVTDFYKTWYVPANATLTIAGDFEAAEAKQLVEKWFGSFPKSVKPPVKQAPPFPEIEQARKVVKDDFAKLEQIIYAWHTPAVFQSGDAELAILANALGASGTGRLYKALVHKQQLAQSVSVRQSSKEFSSTFTVTVTLKSDTKLDDVEKVLEMEIGKVMTTPISQREFDRAITRRESAFVWGLESILARAETLQRYNHYVGSPDYITQDLDRYRKTNPDQVTKVAAKYLGTSSRVEIHTVPSDKGGK